MNPVVEFHEPTSVNSQQKLSGNENSRTSLCIVSDIDDVTQLDNIESIPAHIRYSRTITLPVSHEFNKQVVEVHKAMPVKPRRLIVSDHLYSRANPYIFNDNDGSDSDTSSDEINSIPEYSRKARSIMTRGSESSVNEMGNASHGDQLCAAGSSTQTDSICRPTTITPNQQQIIKGVFNTFQQKQARYSLQEKKEMEVDSCTDPMAVCAVKHCTNKRIPPVILHRFPQEIERATQWAINAGRLDLLESEEIFQRLHNNYQICSLHFEKHCFTNALKKDLIKDAVPTLFLTEGKHFVKAPSKSFAVSSNLAMEHLVKQDQQSSSISTKTLKENIHVSPINSDVHQHEVRDAHESDMTSASPIGDTDAYLSTGETPLVDISNRASQKLCRLCATVVHCTKMIHIFGKKSTHKGYLCKMNKLLPFTDRVVENDFLPQWICVNCSNKLDICHQLMQDFRAANTKLKQLLKITPKHDAFVKKKMSREQTITCRMEKPVSIDEIEEFESLEDNQSFNYAINTETNFDDPFEDNLEPSQQMETTELACHQTVFDTNSVCPDSLFTPDSSSILDDSSKFTCSQCDKFFSDKASLFYHEITKHTLTVIPTTTQANQSKKLSQKTFRTSGSIKSTGYMSGIVDVKKIHSKRKKLRSINEPITGFETEISEDYTSSDEDDVIDLASCSEAKRLKQSSEQDKLIQESHISIPTSIDNNAFLCSVCNGIFDTIESLLTHRFKEHPLEEIVRGRLACFQK